MFLTAGRHYLCTVQVRAVSLSGNGHFSIRTSNGTGIVNTNLSFDVLCSVIGGGLFGMGYASIPFGVTSSGLFTIPVYLMAPAGITGTAYLDNGTHIRVEDIGPNRGQQ